MPKRWALIVGAKGSGKSSLAARAVGALEARGLSVGGVLQEAVTEDGERVGYRARRLGVEGEEVLVARRGAPPEGSSDALREFCSFVFDEAAFARARRWVAQSARESDVTVVDEVSKLEVSRGGHHDAIVDALESDAVVILVVRADQLFAVVERFELDDAVATLDATDETALPTFAAAVMSATRGRTEP